MDGVSGCRRILVVEDERSIRDSIVYALESEGFAVEVAETGAEALECLSHGAFHLVVLDVGLPDLSGFDVCRRLRRSSTVPVIFLTARSSEIDRVVGLEIGADDYVSKPFSPRELSARVRANLRRVELDCPGLPKPAGVCVAAVGTPLVVDRERYRVQYFEHELKLSRYEYRLLVTLFEKPGRVFTRVQLMDAVWEEPDASMERTVDAHIKMLRSKLKAVRGDVELIETHRGVGYSMKEVW